jgi:hypothetical protein
MDNYFRTLDSEYCFPIQSHLDYMKENNIHQMTIYKARQVHGTGMFYCQAFGEIGEVGEGCGKACDLYKPRNGKSGICTHYRLPVEPSDLFTLIY